MLFASYVSAVRIALLLDTSRTGTYKAVNSRGKSALAVRVTLTVTDPQHKTPTPPDTIHHTFTPTNTI